MKGLTYNHEAMRAANNEQKPNVSEICREIGISRTHFYKVINGRGGSPKIISLLCAKLGLRPEAVLQFDV